MKPLQFEFRSGCKRDELFGLASDFERLSKFFTRQVESIRTVRSENNIITTEETIILTSFIRARFVQQTEHVIDREKHAIHNRIMTGGFAGSAIDAEFLPAENGTVIRVALNLKTNMRMRIMSPMIKKYYKIILTGLFYKMNTEITKNV